MRLASVALVAVALLVAASAAPAASFTKCGRANVNGYPDNPLRVKAEHTTCAEAKRVARKHYRRIGDGKSCNLKNASCVVLGFTCRRSFFGNSGTRVRCAKGEARVRFIYGV
jgi:hypothetical protein